LRNLDHLTKAQLQGEIDRLTYIVQELELALKNQNPNLELRNDTGSSIRNRSLSGFVRLAMFPLVAGIFRRIYNYAYRQKN
jgi:hypothetical protein